MRPFSFFFFFFYFIHSVKAVPKISPCCAASLFILSIIESILKHKCFLHLSFYGILGRLCLKAVALPG